MTGSFYAVLLLMLPLSCNSFTFSLLKLFCFKYDIAYVTLSGELSRAELMMMTIADVIKQLVEAHEGGKDINLNK